MSKMIRISEASYSKLQKLAKKRGSTRQAMLDEAIEKIARQQLLIDANNAYAALKKDTKRWQEEQVERREFEDTLLDGLEDD